jgi:response regulator RpfG family c-di-GMP phosphodiesterase
MPERILCVDDEPNVLAGYQRQLRKQFEIDVAVGGESGLAAVRDRGPYAVIVSDMRMPGMNGAQLLARVRETAPDSVRMLLTGHADQQTAIAAVNEGHIFRFLTKPCPSETFVKALEAGVHQYRLVTAEKELLEKTLRGSVEVLTEVLALASPAAFTRATRVRRLARQLAVAVRADSPWAIEVAALLSPIGCVAVPDDVLARVGSGQELAEKDRVMFESHARVGASLIGKIPRLEAIAEIIAYQDKHFDGTGRPEGGKSGAAIPLGARILKLALDCDSLEARGQPRFRALECLRGRAGRYDPNVLRALEDLPADASGHATKSVSAAELRCGMILAEDIRNTGGLMLVSKGKEVTEIVLQRLQNLCASGAVREPIQVLA